MSSPEASSSSEDEFDLSAPSTKPAVREGGDAGASDAKKEASHAGLFSDDEDDDDSAEDKPASAPATENTSAKAGGSSDDDQDKEKEMEDLFGSDYDSEEEEFKASGVKESPVRDENRGASQDLYAEDHGVSHHGGSGHSNEIWLPKTPKPSKTTTSFVCKMPNILRLVPEAYTKQAIEEEMSNPSDEMLYRNYVRWRYQRDEEGKVKIDPVTRKPLRESNAKVVQWEDGSLTLFVGKEALNLSRQKIPNSFLFVNEVSSDKPHLDEDPEAPGQETVLECHGRLKEKLTIRPTTTSSKSHKSLTMSMRAKHNKGVQKIKHYISEMDGEREQEQRAKINEDRLRLQNRKKSRQTYEDDRGRAARMDASFLEEGYDGGDYDDGDNVAAIKEQFGGRSRNKGGAARRPAPPARRPSASSFSGDGFDEYSRSRAREEDTRSDSEQDQAADELDDDDDDEEEEIVRNVKKRRTVDEEDSE
jgi:RNA polymerase-associated protein LEO1